MTRKPVFAVLGAGNGGFCMSADLTLRGFEVRLFELPAFAHTIDPIIERGGIALRGVVGEGFARPTMVTTDIEAALGGADAVMVVAAAMGHGAIARECAPFLEENQVVVLCPGSCGGLLAFRHALRMEGFNKKIILAETASLMYAVKKESANRVWARGRKHNLTVGALPKDKTAAVLELLSPAYPLFEAAPNILDVTLSNLNNITHPAPALTNIGFIEGSCLDEWLFYTDGMTPGAGRLADQLDRERLAVMRAYGLNGASSVELIRRFYGHQGMKGNNFFEYFHDSPIHRKTKGPRSTRDRLITEDISYGLVPMAAFGDVAGVPTPTMDAFITLAEVVNEADYRKSGRTLEKMGLSGMDVNDIIGLVNNGY
ncbi:MAG: NAD/NADP octopine/nopaline dehydrogenase family protein [Candidatus Thermoplasmatota archaeon]|nr:NAD/NADP octopine/nopaline dehydrogenase family protein [Candidatus Thermoplasmatota archaeon]